MSHDLVPSDDRIGRDALERIIHRAAELQANQRDIGDRMTEQDVLDLGKDVGIPARHLQQALLEERARAVTASDRGFLVKLAGAKRCSAERTVPGGQAEVEQALSYWMTDVELLTVKRRYAQGTSWEARKDFFAAMKRGMGMGGRQYALVRAKEILGRVETLEDGWCHVTLIADLSHTRAERLAGGAAFFGAGGTMSLIASVLGVAAVVAVLPLAVGAAAGYAIARSNRAQVERTSVAMEQILDRLERMEILLPEGSAKSGSRDFVDRLKAEIKQLGKSLGA